MTGPRGYCPIGWRTCLTTWALLVCKTQLGWHPYLGAVRIPWYGTASQEHSVDSVWPFYLCLGASFLPASTCLSCQGAQPAPTMSFSNTQHQGPLISVKNSGLLSDVNNKLHIGCSPSFYGWNNGGLSRISNLSMKLMTEWGGKSLSVNFQTCAWSTISSCNRLSRTASSWLLLTHLIREKQKVLVLLQSSMMYSRSEELNVRKWSLFITLPVVAPLWAD